MKRNIGEGSAADIAQDKRDAKRAGKTQAEYEGSPADEKKDAARKRTKRAKPEVEHMHESTKGFEHDHYEHTSEDR